MTTEALVAALESAHAAQERDDRAGAVTAFRRAMELAPGNAGVTIALANAHRLAGEPLEARAALERTAAVLLATPPTDTSVGDAYGLGAALLEAGAPVEAAQCFERVVAARPDDAAALAALASARRALGDVSRAWPLVQRAIASTGASTDAHPAYLLTAAQIRHALGDLRGALHWLEKAERARPDHTPTRLQRAFTTLLGGASTAGWELFESRALPSPPTSARPWNGEALDGGSVLVTAEQGIGDQFQFLRFVPLLTARGAGRVIVECHADVVSLFESNGYEAIARGSTMETTWHVPLLSLPYQLRIDTNVLGDAVPYLRAPVVERPSRARPRLGLVWAGNPAFPGRVTRDLDPSMLPSILAIDTIDWVSLQHGMAGDVSDRRLERIELPRDWSATANLLASLDGLVTTDTGIAHLAGAMGVATWTLLEFVPDWRWGLRAERTPWYPAMHLVRQPRARDWGAAVRTLTTELAKHFAR